MSLGIMVFAAVKENFWVRELAETTAHTLTADLDNVPLCLMITMIVFGIILWVATILSVYKPWGRTPRGQQQWLRKRGASTQGFPSVDSVA